MTMELDKCPITGLKLKNYNQVDYNHTYQVDNYSNTKSFFITDGCCQEKFVVDNQHIFRSLFLQNRFPYLASKLITPNDLESLLKGGNYPKNPKAKLDSLLVGIFKTLENNGFASMVNLISLQHFFFFKNRNELLIYLNALNEDDLIERGIAEEEGLMDIKLTFKGINYVSSLMENGSESRNAFIAMSFGEECKPIRDVLKQACLDTGYQQS